jgi:hypothetical protein
MRLLKIQVSEEYKETKLAKFCQKKTYRLDQTYPTTHIEEAAASTTIIIENISGRMNLPLEFELAVTMNAASLQMTKFLYLPCKTCNARQQLYHMHRSSTEPAVSSGHVNGELRVATQGQWRIPHRLWDDYTLLATEHTTTPSMKIALSQR